MNRSILLLFCSILFSWNFFVNAQATNSQASTSKRPKVGLVLSGGGAKGLAHIGVLKVLEEAGIYPDFIGGTSMGGIVAGLYAIGYSADSLDHLARTIHWSYYLSDKIPRRNVTLEEKEDQDRFVLSFPLKEKRIQIPSGMVNGQNIENLLNKLCSPVYDIHDFSQLKIPFLCVATDIENGHEVVLKNGYLPKVLRATMSIPSIFNPIEIESRLLVDGGLINNLPAQRVKEMGADIIIGVNVGFHPYSKVELGSMFRIIEQTLYFYGEDLNNKNKAMCDLLISPELSNYNASSFNSTDSIISIGEKAAREIFPKLKALADSLKSLDPDYGLPQEISQIDSIQLMEIHLKGIENVSSKLVYGKLQITVLQKVTPDDLEKAIERVYSSLYFENVTYEIRQVERGASLIVNLEEKKGAFIRVGIHYDTYNKSAILLNLTVRNLLLEGSKLSVNTALGENPFFRASLIKNNGWKPGIGFNFESNRNLMYFYRDSKKISTISYAVSKVQLYTQSILQNSFAFGAGIEAENSLIKPIIDPVSGIEKERNDFINYYGFLNLDSYDNAFYPHQGVKLQSELKLITALKNYTPVIFFCSEFSFAGRISRRISLIGHISGGAIRGDSIPPQYMLYTGGLTENSIKGILPFVGLDYMEESNRNVLLTGLDLQLRFWEKFYVILRGNVGNSKNTIDELLSYDKLISGYGITLGYDSLIGPVEVTSSSSGTQKGLLGYVRIGFYF